MSDNFAHKRRVLYLGTVPHLGKAPSPVVVLSQGKLHQEAIPTKEKAPDHPDSSSRLGEVALKNLNSKMVSQKNLDESERVEKEITQHFVYLHGILQNIEENLKKKLRDRRAKLHRDVEEMRDVLSNQEEKMHYANTMATIAKNNFVRVNLKKITDEILSLADSPCHVLAAENSNEQIKMTLDRTVISSLEQHVQLQVPEAPKFKLLRTDELPENYELEPLPSSDTNSTIKLNLKDEFLPNSLENETNSTATQSMEDSTLETSSLEKNTSDQVRVTHLKDPTDFYVQRISTQRYIQEIEANIAEHVKNTTDIPEEINLNQIYLVQNSTDLKWFRGRVIKKTDEERSTYRVFFIDYGLTENHVSLVRIRKTMPQFNIEGPAALHCSLAEIAPMEEKWSYLVIDQFKNMVSGVTLTMKILQTKDVIHIVDLLKLHCNKILSIHNWLIDSKLAKSTTFYKLMRMNPMSANHFHLEDLPLKKYVKIYISRIESPNYMYARKAHNREFEEQMNIFQEQYSRLNSNEDLSIENPEYGNAVGLMHQLVWQRGTIAKIYSDEKKVDVFLVDLGVMKKVNYFQIKHLPQRFRKWNAQAFKVSLTDIKPARGDEWSEEAVTYLKNNVENRYVKIITFSKVMDIYQSCIYVKNDVNVNAHLVERGYALSTGANSVHLNLNSNICALKKPRKKPTKKKYLVPAATKSEAEPSKERKPPKTIEEIDPFKVRVFIIKAISPACIYVSDASNVKKYEQMCVELQSFYESNSCEWNRELKPEIYYCVYSRKDKQYCRAQFLRMCDNEPTMALMSLVDLAEEDLISLEHIQPLDNKFFFTPKYIFKVKLAGITPCAGSTVWQSSSCQKLNTIIHDTGESKYYITLVENCEPGGVLPVELCIRRNVVSGPIAPNKKVTFSVARKLIDEGLALPIRGYFENDGKALATELKKKLRLKGCHSEESNENIIKHIAKEGNVEEEGDGESTTNDDQSSSDAKAELDNGQQIVPNAQETTVGDFTDEDELGPPPKIIDWTPAADILESTLIASITYVDFDCCIYFHPDTEEYNDTLQHISDTLNKCYNNRPTKKYDHTWEVGDLCIAKYHYDKNWYRGRVLEIMNHQIVKVIFVDYGNVEECQIGSVKKRIILDDIPIQSTKAIVAGIKPLPGTTWSVPDLDIIHKLLVSKPCKIQILSKPPNPWVAAVWVIENSRTYPLSWYLKNKTQVRCLTETLISESSFSNSDDVTTNTSKTIEKVNKCSVSNSINKEENEATLVNNKEITEDTLQMNSSDLSDTTETDASCSSQRNCSSSSSQLIKAKPKVEPANKRRASLDHCGENSDVSRNCDLYNDVAEQFIAGNSMNFHSQDANSDTMSVKTDVLYNDINNFDLATSTPLNVSVDVLSENIPEKIDFFKHAIRTLKIGIGQAFSPITMSGYILKCNDDVLNLWKSKYYEMHEEIQNDAEIQPFYIPGSAKVCIVKYDLDDLWYRAVVLKDGLLGDPDHLAYVEFLDFGDRQFVTGKNCMRSIKINWLEVPCMSFHFKLHNVRVTSKEKFKYVNRQMSIALSKFEEYFAVIKKYDPELEMELYLDEDCKNLAYGSLIEDNLLEIIVPEFD